MDSNSRPNINTELIAPASSISVLLEKDSIAFLGDEASATVKLFNRLGFNLSVKPSEAGLKSLLLNSPDLILLDTAFTDHPEELILFIRAFEITKDIPIVAFTSSGQAKDFSRDFPNIESVFSTNPGIIAGKAATTLRMAKIRGESKSHSTLHEKNLALKSALKEYKREWADAENIQSTLLSSSKAIQIAELDIALHHQPLHHVGGDWYFIEKTLHNKIFTSLCDVTGHGISAAFLGSMTRLALNACKDMTLSERITKANDLLTPELPEGRFITAVATEYDPITKELELLRAGHPPALLYKNSTATVEEIKPNGFALGFMEGAVFPTQKLSLDSGDILILYSDGITEAANRFKEMFGVPRLKEVLVAASKETSADAVKDYILKAFNTFLDDRKLNDDVTLLVLRVP